MTKGFYYLAVPYQGTEEEKKCRMELSLKAATEFLRQGLHLFAPLIYTNKVADNLKLDSLDKRRDIVMPYLLDFLKVSKGVVLITAEGWQNSWGVHQELKFCHEHHISIYQITPEQLHEDLSSLLFHPLDSRQVEDLLKAYH